MRDEALLRREDGREGSRPAEGADRQETVPRRFCRTSDQASQVTRGGACCVLFHSTLSPILIDNLNRSRFDVKRSTSS